MRPDDSLTGPGQTLAEMIADFVRLADSLGMLAGERAGILGIQPDELARWAESAASDPRRPEFERRLAYALPLMRRALVSFAQGH